MILGQNRVPYAGPPQASGSFRPGMPHMGFYSHFNPFIQVHRRMGAMHNAYMPTAPNAIGPAPSIPTPPPTPVTPAAAASPIGPKGVSGFGFGSTGGTKMHHGHHGINPYMTMREGLIPGIHSNARHLRAGVHHAGTHIKHLFPYQTAALPPPPPPPPPPAVAPGGTKGLFGALFGAGPPRARHHRWWHLNPPSTHEQAVASQTGCETYPPRVDGIKVTVCNGHVTQYEDAQGNITRPGEYGAYPEDGGPMAGFGHSGHHRHHHRHHAAPPAPVAGLGFPWFRRGGGQPWNRGGAPLPYNPGAAPAPGFPHHRHHRHPWQPQPPVPAFGRGW